MNTGRRRLEGIRTGQPGRRAAVARACAALAALALVSLLPSVAVFGDYAPLLVVDAGSALANGTYAQAGIYNGKPYYRSVSANDVRWWGDHWAVTDPLLTELYTNSPNVPTPPASDWVTAAGDSPTPTMSGAEELVPQIDLRWSWNGASIANGDMTPSTGDGTDFGSWSSGATATVTYKIYNTGSADLTVMEVDG